MRFGAVEKHQKKSIVGGKEVDIVPYRPVRPKFFVLVVESVPKHFQNVPLKIPAYIKQYRSYRSIPYVSAGTKTKRKNRRNA